MRLVRRQNETTTTATTRGIPVSTWDTGILGNRRKTKTCFLFSVVTAAVATFSIAIFPNRTYGGDGENQSSITIIPDHPSQLVEKQINSKINNKEQHDDDPTRLPFKPFIPWKERNVTYPLPCILERNNYIDNDNDNWNPWNHHAQRQPSKDGLLFIKIEKAASSTLAGVAFRLSQKLVLRVTAVPNRNTTFIHNNNNNNNASKSPRGHSTNSSSSYSSSSSSRRPLSCKVRASHLWSQRQDRLSSRDLTKSFLFTFLRHPADRLWSLYHYFWVDRGPATKGIPPAPTDDDTLIQFFTDHANTQLQKLTDPIPSWVTLGNHNGNNGGGGNAVSEKDLLKFLSKSQIIAYLQRALNNMDFVGLVERMDESLVILQLLLDLKPSDVMVVESAKQSGHHQYFYNRHTQQGRCVAIPARPYSPRVMEFIHSRPYKEEINLGDELLYDAVNRSIDYTIDSVIGRERFQQAMAQYQEVKTQIQTHCASKLILACTDNGTVVPKRQQDACYVGDMGCGYQCLDRLFPN